MKRKIKKQELIHLIPLCLGVLVLTFTLSYLVSAWTEPTELPPGGNVATPLNIGDIAQSKLGTLILNLSNRNTGLIVVGRIGVNTVAGTPPTVYEPNYTLDVNGDLNLGTSVLRLNGATGTNKQVLASVMLPENFIGLI